MCSDQTKSELNIYNPHRQFCYVFLCVACNEFCQDHLRKPTKIDAIVHNNQYTKSTKRSETKKVKFFIVKKMHMRWKHS